MENKLHAKIVSLVPEIKELKRGCVVRDFFKGTLTILAKYEIAGETPVYDYVFFGEDDVSVARSPRGNWDILGRPITLADVLRAIDSDWKKSLSGGQINGSVTIGLQLLAIWNLSQHLDGQSDETKAFISKILGV